MKPSQIILQKGLTEMPVQKRTANARPVLAVGVFGALPCCLWGKWFLGWGFDGFLGVGEGRGIVVNDTAATKPNGLKKQAVCSAAMPLGGAARCGADPRLPLCPRRAAASPGCPRGCQARRPPLGPRCCFSPDI